MVSPLALSGIEVAEVVTAFEEAEDADSSILPADIENEIDLTGTRTAVSTIKQAAAVTEAAAAFASFTKERRRKEISKIVLIEYKFILQSPINNFSSFVASRLNNLKHQRCYLNFHNWLRRWGDWIMDNRVQNSWLSRIPNPFPNQIYLV